MGTTLLQSQLHIHPLKFACTYLLGHPYPNMWAPHIFVSSVIGELPTTWMESYPGMLPLHDTLAALLLPQASGGGHHLAAAESNLGVLGILLAWPKQNTSWVPTQGL